MRLHNLIIVALLIIGTMLCSQISPVTAHAYIGPLGNNPSDKFDQDGKPLTDVQSIDHHHALRAVPNTATSPTVFPAECPPTVHCVVIPAAYGPNNGNVQDYGNYDLANRPSDMSINTIVIHDTEGNLQSTLDAFQNPAYYSSAHYVINSDGIIYQMVPTKDIAWHAGNWSTNMHSIGIEHVGSAADSHSYTPQMSYASEQLVQYLTTKFHIPRDRGHIIGHDNVPAPTQAAVSTMHVDPGPFWNWQNYMAPLTAPTLPSINFVNNLVTIATIWPLSKQPVTGCSDAAGTSCVPAAAQPTNFVYLRTQPNSNASFFSDSVLGQGTTAISNNAARLFYGQTFAIADRRIDLQGIWYQVWVNGAKGWFYSPWAAPTAYATTGKFVTPKSGASIIAAYGRATPERSEYPPDLIAVPPASFYIPAATPLPYTLNSGQRYALISTDVPTDYYYAWASDSSFPYDHTLFTGSTKYVEIQLGNRVGFVKAIDVNIQ